ncbi:DUF1236 domain-containing protein [Gellertiella hungarica]|uniref:DUF1236 domain-containing protein n=1 Tax=Gellertiella hungarica TaxID=1572859 RepID=A0A7W6J7D1_9HYPH|nr:DUF1236 domain-containing protein [Gellertiella hungarica]MBB4066166.1 hypothetical protein [Gellertiella hungarica]
MKQLARMAVAAFILTGGSCVALAQDVVITTEQEPVITEYVTKHTVTSVDVPDVEVTVGTALPDTVELHRIEAPDVNYEYTVVNGTTVIVDPGTRKIIKVVQ